MQRPLKLISILIITLLISYCLAFAEQSELLTKTEYFTQVRNALQGASETIYIQMYFIIADPKDAEDPISIFLDDLFKAKDRGVDVKIVLENSKFRESHFAYKLLKEHGIQVDFDSADTLLHSKAIVIDNKLCIIGSTNWSRAAIYDNREVSILIHSEKIAKDLLEDIKSIKLSKDIPVLPIKHKGIDMPVDFLLNTEAGPQIIKDRANIAFELYLLLLKESQNAKSSTIPIDYKKLATSLGYSKKNISSKDRRYVNNYYYEKLRRPLKRLQDKYKLISYNHKQKEIEMFYPVKKQDSIVLPYQYWEYGLNERLSLRARYLYLISLLEASKSTKNPYWFRSQQDLALMYHLSDYTISLGLQELEKENILEITRSASKGNDFAQRKANVYCQNPLISDEEFEEEIDKLIQKYGQKTTKQAQKLSAQLDEPKDLNTIETYIHLIGKHGYKKVKAANDITARRKKGSAQRDISYVIEQL